jgi:hypothetical protein
VRTVLLSIQSLLGEPNNDSPLNPYAAKVGVYFLPPLPPMVHAIRQLTSATIGRAQNECM